MLTGEEKSMIIDALSIWAESAPDEPTIGFLDNGYLLKPRELVVAVRVGTSDGLAALEILEHGVRREGIESVTRRLRRRGVQARGVQA